MKKPKKKILIFLLIIALVTIGISLGIYLTGRKKSNVLTLEETQWIEKNKHTVIDIAVLNDIPIISNNGSGIVYDYLNYSSSKTSLEFNIIPYKFNAKVDSQYKLDLVGKPSKDDIVVYEDNLVYISVEKKEYKSLDEIVNLKIGVLKSQKEELAAYFKDSGIELVEYEDYDKLKAAMSEAKTNVDAQTPPSINGIIITKSLYTKEIVEKNYKISYQFNDLKRYYVLTINDSIELKNIMLKEYKNWKLKEYRESYNNNLLKDYLAFKNISDVEEKKLKSKSYVYGFINYGIFNTMNNKDLKGFNGILLKGFNEFSGISITYTKYNSVNTLLQAFNSKKVDFILNLSEEKNYKNEIYKTVGSIDKKLIVASGINNKNMIDNVLALQNLEVLAIKDTALEEYLKSLGAKVKSYNNLEELVNDFKSNSVVVIDLDNYNYYKTSAFKDSKIDCLLNDNSKYNFVINDNEENKSFKDLFNFYISYISLNDMISSQYSDIAYENKDIQSVLITIIIALLVYIVVDFSYHIKGLFKFITSRRKVKFTKEDKMKYIDQLTSLKNRNYLNSKIEEWDDSEVYPQSVIIVDLNNVSYINDNYGREEGDKVIKEAANILMQHQLENSEIIRTDGNEFLIFLVGYTEKQVISYLRKLNREFKNLSHGFGAASGYSIISDAIKTFDDAVNEAVLDMKSNKEDIDY